MPKGKFWLCQEESVLRELYPTRIHMSQLCKELAKVRPDGYIRNADSVHQHANGMGLERHGKNQPPRGPYATMKNREHTSDEPRSFKNY